MNLKFPHPLQLLGDGMEPPSDVLVQASRWHESGDLIDGLMMVGLLGRLGFVPADKKKAIEDWMMDGVPHPLTRVQQWVREHCTEEILDYVERVVGDESLTILANLDLLPKLDDQLRIEHTFWACQNRDDLQCLCMVLWWAGRRYESERCPSDLLVGIDHTAEHCYRKYVDKLPYERWTERLREAALHDNCSIWWGPRYS